MSQSPIKLNPSQQNALDALADFLQQPHPIFLLKGSAGTGKTTLIKRIAELLDARDRPFQLAAPTGRAARILYSRTKLDTSTIHGLLYHQPRIEVIEDAESPNDPGMRLYFPARRDDPMDTVFIIDEASMVGDKESKGDLIKFGSGRLLADLVDYARLGRAGEGNDRRVKIIFVGDPAQLPPVGETLSPAMSAEYLRSEFGLESEQIELTEVMRQQRDSAILDRATELRNAIAEKRFNRFDISGDDDQISSCTPSEGVDIMLELRQEKGSTCVFITRTNEHALKLNQSVRARIWGDENTAMSPGDILLVNRNNYKCYLSNGDLVRVETLNGSPIRRLINLKIKPRSDEVSRSFNSVHVKINGDRAQVEIGFQPVRILYRALDSSVQRSDCLLLDNLLGSEERELTPLEVRALLVDFRQRHPGLKPGTAEFGITLKDDPYFNALQVKYGYAMTCHKAQGGEWDTAIVDFSGGGGARNEQFFRWSYTAITRARSRLFTIGAPMITLTSELVWECLGAGNATASRSDDADWGRLGFVTGQEKLFLYHLALREAWTREGVRIERLDHLQYAERYLLSRGNEQAHVQYYYTGDQKVSRIAAASGKPQATSDLLRTVLEAMETALISLASGDQGGLPPFIENFRLRLEQATKGTDIRLLGVEHRDYRLRAIFEYRNGRVPIDFCYNKKQQWTSASEVGGLGKSGGLIERLRTLIEE